jgi:hypothetical protein
MARRLLSLDVTGTIIRVRGSVGELYSKAARNVLGTVQEQADTERLDKSFGNAFNSMFQSHPNFGASSSMTSKQWWREVVCKTFTDAGMTLGGTVS